jgi:hypothetical protein
MHSRSNRRLRARVSLDATAMRRARAYSSLRYFGAVSLIAWSSFVAASCRDEVPANKEGTSAGGSVGSAGNGSTPDGATGDGSGDSGGGGGDSGASAGTGGKPDGGNPTSCPTEPPRGTDPCPQGVKENGCRYRIPCQSGSVDFVLTCAESGGTYWTVSAPSQCELDYDSCPGTDVQCVSDRRWRMIGGILSPPDCPDARPRPGTSCSGSVDGAPRCGYRCESATGWTIASCIPVSGGQSSLWTGTWLLDGGCPMNCSNQENQLVAYAREHFACTSADGCGLVKTSCLEGVDGCTEALSVGTTSTGDTFDLSQWKALEAALASCAASSPSWRCPSCVTPDRAVDCRNGQCAFAF